MCLIENMTRFCFFTQFLLLSSAMFLLACGSNPIKVVPQSHRTAGVFMLIEGGEYTFNFTAATAACLSLNVSMATREQVERALQHGLETCKYGWTADQIAVIPRLTADKNCGKGKTGVLTWLTNTDKKFAVFCFNASDLEETPNTSTVSQQSSTFPTTPTAPHSSTPATPATPLLRQTSKSPPLGKHRTTKAPEQTTFTSAFTLLLKTTHSTRIPTTSTAFKTFSTTSKPAAVSFAFSTSVHAFNFSVSSESAVAPTLSSAKPLGDVPTALIIVGIILLLLTAAGVVWYCKLNIFTFWPQGRQKDDIETEMWKHTNSETDLHSQHEGEEDESDRKYSSDIMLCVNPHFKTNSSE